MGNAGQKQRHAPDVAVVLARLVGAAGEDVFDGLRRQAGRFRQKRLQNMGEKIIGPHARQRPGVAPDGRAHAGANKGFSHLACIHSIEKRSAI